jgi:hypothetical protein
MGTAAKLRLLRHNQRRQIREQSPYWHKRGNNTGADCRCGVFAFVMAGSTRIAAEWAKRIFTTADKEKSQK